MSALQLDKNLTFQKRIQLKSSHINSDTRASSIKLYDNTMYVMFDWTKKQYSLIKEN